VFSAKEKGYLGVTYVPNPWVNNVSKKLKDKRDDTLDRRDFSKFKNPNLSPKIGRWRQKPQ
jgi:hypothetical protein